MSFIEDYGGYYVDKKHGDGVADKVIYLTFDAGYENGNVEKIVDVLGEEGVPAAFFVLDNLITKNKALVMRMIEEGHLVCNHTSKHLDVTKCKTLDEFKAELESLEDIYREVTGCEMPKYFRPPEGKFDEKTLKYANDLGYKTIFWSLAYADWDNNKQPDPEASKKLLLDNIHNGAVILLHPTSTTNAQILSDLITSLKSEGYRFGSLYELVGAEGGDK